MVKLSLSQSTVETFAANSTQKAMMVHRRLSQKKNSVIESVPLLKQTKEKVTDFDHKMTERFGKNYTKIRNIVVDAGKFYLAGQLGAAGLIALGTINVAKSLKPIIKEAQEQREAGKVSGIVDFIKKNPKNSATTMISASLGAAVIGCGLADAAGAKLCSRAGVAALVVIPEMKSLKETTKKWVNGEISFKNVINDIAAVSLSAGSFIAGSDWDFANTDAMSASGGESVSIDIAAADNCPPPAAPPFPSFSPPPPPSAPCMAPPKHEPTESLQSTLMNNASANKTATQKAQKVQKNKTITLATLKKKEKTQ